MVWVAAVVCLTGCSSPRWHVFRADYSYGTPKESEGDYSTQNTLLLDTRTGKTWILEPSEGDDPETWIWKEILRQR